MANNVHLEDFSRMVIEAVKDAGAAILEEAAGEVVSQTRRNLGKERGRWHQEQKERWDYIVDNNKLEATIGNPLERSLWTEFGTGSYAEGGKGRQGYWVYVKGSGSENSPSNDKRSYTLEEAKKIMAMLKADGLDAHITKGQSPKRPFRTAYNTTRPKIERRAAQVLKNHLK
jgi:hypothetical protein